MHRVEPAALKGRWDDTQEALGTSSVSRSPQLPPAPAKRWEVSQTRRGMGQRQTASPEELGNQPWHLTPAQGCLSRIYTALPWRAGPQGTGLGSPGIPTPTPIPNSPQGGRTGPIVAEGSASSSGPVVPSLGELQGRLRRKWEQAGSCCPPSTASRTALDGEFVRCCRASRAPGRPGLHSPPPTPCQA